MVVGGENSKIEWVDMKKRHFKIIENTDHAHRARLACHPTAAPIRGRERGKRVVVEHRVVRRGLRSLLGNQVQRLERLERLPGGRRGTWRTGCSYSFHCSET